MKRSVRYLFLSLLLCGSVSSGRAAETGVKPSATPTAPDAESPTAEVVRSRLVKYGERDVVAVRAKLRYTTMIILPKEERILDFTCGDKDFWAVDGNENFAFVKPAKAGASTNVNLITASGNVYSFVLTEISETNAGESDLKVFVEPKDQSMLSSARGEPRFVPASQIADYQQQIQLAKAESRQAKEEAQQLIDGKISEFRSQYPSSLQFVYRFPRGRKPFLVDAIYHDGRFTYIKASPQETPALYEIKDGKPNLVNFDFRDGTFVVSKVLESGYLAIGKQKMNFVRED